jgi:hypothetical protein
MHRNSNFSGNSYTNTYHSNFSSASNNSSYTRERFNSEGNNTPINKLSIPNDNYNSARNSERFEEIEIDITNIKYTLNSK